jgi:tetratricopeptide (TPR) repeat protein
LRALRSIAGGGLVLLAALAFASPTPARPAPGDAAVAQTLLKSGREAHNKRQYDEAVRLLRKAVEEDVHLAEARWWIASSLEKSGDKPQALAEYRAFVAQVVAKGASASKEETRLKALADKSIAVLAAAEKELLRLEDGYVARLLAFAKDSFVRDPGVAQKAVARILEVRPDHEEALRMARQLGVAAPGSGKASSSGADAAMGPAKEVKTWKDLLADRWFKASDIMVYENGGLVFDAKGGKKVTGSGYLGGRKNYVIEAEVIVAETYSSGWLVGFTFAERAKSFYSAFLGRSRITLIEGNDSGNRDLDVHDKGPTEVGTTHRFCVAVRGNTLEVWLDGKRALERLIQGRDDLDGEIGLFQQGCRVEFRSLRLGDL